jgi:hypothetical protein
MKSVLNEAYMTPDTPFHEILAHPIIRAIKNTQVSKKAKFDISNFEVKKDYKNNTWYIDFKPGYYREDFKSFLKTGFESRLNAENSLRNNYSQLYQNLLKELETGRGKEVFEQVKIDYASKQTKYPILERVGKVPYGGIYEKDGIIYSVNGKDFFNKDEAIKFQNNNLDFSQKYTLEEQQEEAIVQIIGLYSAQKLDKLKDKTLIQLIKELLKEMSDFVKLIFKKEINITKDLDNISELTDTELNKLLKNGEITKKC